LTAQTPDGTPASKGRLLPSDEKQAMPDSLIIHATGALAAAASVASFAPQAWKTIATRNVKGLSAAMYALTIAAFALWTGYGAMLGNWALIVPNVICLALAGFIFVMIVSPQRTRARIADALDPGVGAGDG
jgi:MtN3 and saliva related transmembrane protein